MVTAPLASQLAPLVNCPKLSGGGGGDGGGDGGGGDSAAGRTQTQDRSVVHPHVDAEMELNIR